MAPALTSNSFLFTTPHSKPTHRYSKLTVFAQANGKPSPFSFGLGKKQAENGSEADEPSDNPMNNFFSNFRGNIDVSDVKSLIPVVSKPSFSLGTNKRPKDGGTVFVAGATGQAGIRIAQTLLRKGFTVRAGVPDLGAAQELALVASTYKIISPEESKRLYAVESTYQDAESIAKAIGNASKAVVTIGPTENGPTTVVTTTDALQVILASALAGVGHVAIIYDSKSSSSPSNYNNVVDGISSFFGNFFSPKTKALTMTEFLQKLVEADVSYTLIKTNLTEDFSEESSYNVVVSAEGSGANDFKVSKSQIASLVADVFSNTALAENKVFEVSTSPSAPSKSADQLFGAIPEDGRRTAYAEAMARAKAEEEAIIASEKARLAADAATKLQAEVKKLSAQEAIASSLAEEAKKKADAAGTSVENLVNKAKDIGSKFSWKEFSTQLQTAVQNPDDGPRVQIATMRGMAKARKLPTQKAVVRKASPKSKAEPAEAKKDVRKVFGGLFKQETIYVDDD